jgi:hypothetical protein
MYEEKLIFTRERGNVSLKIRNKPVVGGHRYRKVDTLYIVKVSGKRAKNGDNSNRGNLSLAKHSRWIHGLQITSGLFLTLAFAILTTLLMWSQTSWKLFFSKHLRFPLSLTICVQLKVCTTKLARPMEK